MKNDDQQDVKRNGWVDTLCDIFIILATLMTGGDS